ncbi:hypothetical protein [Ruminococcus champanellensis]|uniref:hypothetical protein n=1 Tax=Ruminococcus champanellensis TaxID=1161942 RepID=UPI002053C489|nr:hypothetical protein [Ruminococcus champanellensis]MED9891317.1 hypothetical protein [Ruminococcus champanellensis]DAL70435.1 MAG TPA: nucleotide cyclae cyclase [Caudoviricetes sp.]
MDENLHYQNSLVIFIDLLGTQNRSGFDELYKINSIFHNEFEANQANDNSYKAYSRKIYTFSDCAYIIYRDKQNNPDNNGKLFTVALYNTLSILTKFLQEKMIFRGGITYGDVYYDNDRSMFFGEAINRAYQLESKIAINPRIVIDDEVANTIIKFIEEQKHKLPEYAYYCGMGLLLKCPELLEGIVEQDCDGKYIFNYLFWQENDEPFDAIGSSRDEFLLDLIDYCMQQFSSSNIMKVIDKYRYLLEFCRKKYDNLREQRDTSDTIHSIID